MLLYSKVVKQEFSHGDGARGDSKVSETFKGNAHQEFHSTEHGFAFAHFGGLS